MYMWCACICMYVSVPACVYTRGNIPLEALKEQGIQASWNRIRRLGAEDGNL